MVAAAGRSGTSATGGILHHLGLPMGRGIFANGKCNPKGFFSDLDLVDINMKAVGDNNDPLPVMEIHQNAEVLTPQYLEWIHKRNNVPLWGVNEVLLSWTGQHVIELLLDNDIDVKLIQTRRPLHAMTSSLVEMHRGELSYKDAELLQMRFMGAAAMLRDYALEVSVPVHDVHFDKLINNPRETVYEISNFVFGNEAPSLDSAIEFIDPELCHH